MNEITPTNSHVARIWWLILWRGLLGSMLMGGVLGAVIGFVGAAAGVNLNSIQLLSTALGGLVGLGWGFLVVGQALRKNYDGFRIALVPATR